MLSETSHNIIWIINHKTYHETSHKKERQKNKILETDHNSWCTAFEEFRQLDHPFNCEDLRNSINATHNLEQFPATYILQKGWGPPITFHAIPTTSTMMAPVVHTVITALHIKEDCNSASLAALIIYLENALMDISVVVALPVASTLLLLRVPQILQQLLELLQVTILVLPTAA